MISGCTDERESVDDAKCNIVSIGLICHSYTMVCPPVRGNPNALASELSPIHMDTHGVTILYHIHEEFSGSVLDCQTWERRVLCLALVKPKTTGKRTRHD